MPSSKPKIQAYVSDRLYQAVQEWKATNGITGDSEAIERLLSAALDLPSDRDIPGEVLQEIYQRLDALDDRLKKWKPGNPWHFLQSFPLMPMPVGRENGWRLGSPNSGNLPTKGMASLKID